MPGQGNEASAELNAQIATRVSLKFLIFRISLLLWFCIAFINSKHAELEHLLSDSYSLSSWIAVHLAEIALSKVEFT